jgi:uncharacterized phage-associated protein
MVSDKRLAREKLLNAIIFFSKNTLKCQKLKLFKLLFFLDFEIYRETGRSVTGLGYSAWEMGPVPEALYRELKAPLPDFKAAILARPGRLTDPDVDEQGLILTAKKMFDPSCFTARELAKLEHLAEIYREATGQMMIEATHLPRKPWDTVYNRERSPGGAISYRLALDGKPGSISDEHAQAIEDETAEVAAFLERVRK